MRLLLFCICLLTLSLGLPGPKYNSNYWNSDFKQLKEFLSKGYPNLEELNLDLPLLSESTQKLLHQATTDDQARKVLEDFLKTFKDGHLKFEEVNKSQNTKPKELGFRFPTPKEIGFSEVQMVGNAFPITVLESKKKRIGFIRVASFLEKHYPGMTEAQLIQAFESAIQNLNKQQIQALVLDLTNNGGGTNWVGAIMQILTPQPLVCGQFGFIRHAHWTKKFENEKKETQDPIKLASIHKDLLASKENCDRRKLWTQKGFRPKCSLVVKRPEDDCGPNSEYRYTKGLYQGPLYVLVNDGTASASEELVARFKDSGVAKVIGSRTRGSGCGFTNGGIHWELKHSKIQVKIPDCARYFKDGTNEFFGIAPDIELPIQDIKTQVFTLRLKALILSL